MKRLEYLIIALKGLVIGGTMLVPGASGGSMAIVLGIYDKLISAVSLFMEDKKRNFLFLSTFSMGGLLGMYLLATPILKLIQLYEKPTLYFFIGVVLGGIPAVFKRVEIKRIAWQVPVFITIGIGMVLSFSFIPKGVFESGREVGPTMFLWLSLCGFIVAIALILPGISASYMLLVMGLYTETMTSVNKLDIPFLLPLIVGLIAGILIMTKALDKMMKTFPRDTYLIILGFLLGSIREIFPGIPEGMNILYCSLSLALGFGLISLMYLGKRHS